MENTAESIARETQIRASVRRQAEFYKHLISYVLVNAALWSLNAYQIHIGKATGWWVFWTTFGWGIGVVAHAASVFLGQSVFVRDWEARKVAQLIERELKK